MCINQLIFIVLNNQNATGIWGDLILFIDSFIYPQIYVNDSLIPGF